MSGERNTLKHSFYVVIECKKDRFYWRLAAKKVLNKTSAIPACETDQIPLLVNVELPKALFERPELAVNIEVKDDMPRVEIDADTQENLTARIQEIIGIPVTVSVEVPEE